MKKLQILIASSALVISTVASFGSAKSDERVKKAVQESYNFKYHLKSENIKVDANDGVVTLSGSVSDESHKDLARETVANMPGVNKVNDQIELKGKPPAENADSWLYTKVKTTLLFNGNVSSMTDVTVKDSIVTLRGEADSEAEKELTKEYAMDVEGVKEVKNEMTVAGNPRKKSKTQTEIDDASITAQVKYSLFSHRSTSMAKTDVKTKNGIVTLTGKAKNSAEKDLVTKLVANLRGVKKVDNQMTD